MSPAGRTAPKRVSVEERRAFRSGEVSLSASHPSAPGGTSCFGRPSQAVGQKRTRENGENGKEILHREEDRSNRCGFRPGLANKPLSPSHPPHPPSLFITAVSSSLVNSLARAASFDPLGAPSSGLAAEILRFDTEALYRRRARTAEQLRQGHVTTAPPGWSLNASDGQRDGQTDSGGPAATAASS